MLVLNYKRFESTDAMNLMANVLLPEPFCAFATSKLFKSTVKAPSSGETAFPSGGIHWLLPAAVMLAAGKSSLPPLVSSSLLEKS